MAGFRPLIRGFFFYKGWLDTYAKEDTVPVSVPSFGDSFFIEVPYQGGTKVVTLEFPSPHSGILFLCYQ